MTQECKCRCHKVEKYTHPILGDQFFCDCDYPHIPNAKCTPTKISEDGAHDICLREMPKTYK